MRLPEDPIFVIGNPRSGTTLLRFILSSHPRIHIPPETGFLPFLFDAPERELSLAEVEQILDRLGGYNRDWKNVVDDARAFYDTLPCPTLKWVLDALYRQKVAPYGATRWGDKGPSYVAYVPAIAQIFPSAQFVHMIRDGRDTTLSAQRKWGDSHWYMDNYYLLRNWVRNVNRGQEAGAMLGPERYLEIRYEDLVQRPSPVVKRICLFLNEQFDSAMMQHTTLANQLLETDTAYPNVRRPISTQSVQRWKREMVSLDLKLSLRVAGPKLQELGYETPELETFSLAEWARYTFLRCKYLVVDFLRGRLYKHGALVFGHRNRSKILRFFSELSL
jgi:hypothetical protein